MNKKQTKETMKITKQIMDGTLEIFDKNFPNEKNTPLKDKKKIVKFFINLNEFCNKKNIKITKELNHELVKRITTLELQTKVDKIKAELAVKKVSKDVIKINNNQKGNNDR